MRDEKREKCDEFLDTSEVNNGNNSVLNNGRNLVVRDLPSETKGSRFESGC